MKKRKNIAIPMILAATIAAVSVPCSSQIVMASDTYQVGVSKGYLALRSACTAALCMALSIFL